MEHHMIRVYAGRDIDAHGNDRRHNQTKLGGIYGEIGARYAVTVEVPDDLLSTAGRKLVELMDGDFTTGPVRGGEPQMVIRRRRVGVVEAAAMLGHPASVAEALIKTYGEDSVGERIIEEYATGEPQSYQPAALAREINRLAARPGLHVRSADGQTVAVDDKAAAIDETKQAERWGFMLRKVARHRDGAAR